MIIAYSITFALAVLLFVGYFFVVYRKQKDTWLLSLYICVCLVNLGYLLLSVSRNVEFALWANKIAYLGQIFVIMCMFMVIVKLCGFKYKKILPIILIAIGAIVFALILTTGYLPWYYESVDIIQESGGTILVKEYGQLHILYLIYVVLYFTAMIVTIVYSILKKKKGSHKHASLLIAVVFGNIGIWIVEKFIPFNFEFLAVSYIMSEMVFLFFYLTMQDYVHKDAVVPEKTPVVVEEKATTVVLVDTLSRAEKLKSALLYLPEEKSLTAKEIEVLEILLDGKNRKEIAEELNLSANTIKTHIAHIYKKFDVSSKEELITIADKSKISEFN